MYGSPRLSRRPVSLSQTARLLAPTNSWVSRKDLSRKRRNRSNSTSACWQRVDHRQISEAREIPVDTPQDPHAVENTQGGDSGVMYDRTLQQGRPDDLLENTDVTFSLGKESTGYRREEPFDGIQRDIHRGGIFEDSRIGDYREELVRARPRNTNGFRCSNRLGQHRSSAFMEWHFGAVCVDEQVRVDRNHAPRSR